MSSIAALDRRCFLPRPQARPELGADRCFLVGRVPLRPVAMPTPGPSRPPERQGAPAGA
ncbi:hypothetical protein [Phenylobacterium sp. RIFCSPHIGHO2_01_FULL_69_31]|jgi:hypothetical protein|uniref:hypothetical protein n=1 Tax=Phenylobacterium sp. RIFCSPHIGHO2_01_FULL_69_31 TaxID=1801944 RepID=UPI0025D0C9B8|nr:hypothetical protein [Phenylobacterium sp. RIFCSPHIGHO2_01_FULL_69_31]